MSSACFLLLRLACLGPVSDFFPQSEAPRAHVPPDQLEETKSDGSSFGACVPRKAPLGSVSASLPSSRAPVVLFAAIPKGHRPYGFNNVHLFSGSWRPEVHDHSVSSSGFL